MPTFNYEKLFFEIRESPFVRECRTGDGGIVKTYYANQEDEKVGKPTLIRVLKKGGGGKEILYRPNGSPILDVGLKHGKPYGRAKMFDEKGCQIFPNTYWYYGIEITCAYGYFGKLEAEEEKLLKQEKEALKKNEDRNKIFTIQRLYTNRINKVYDQKNIGPILRFYASLFAYEKFIKEPLFKKCFAKER